MRTPGVGHLRWEPSGRRAPADGVEHQLVASKQALDEEERTEGQEGDEQEELAHTIASGCREPAMMPAIIRRTISTVAARHYPRYRDAHGRRPPAQS
ncbi:hypothetical protein [Sinorhizobium meliloti]|uniref:hypothetical protein n=2 Tax=Rhizobium meliloti TaxID=382 RepID=UPI00192E31AC|nr:hypothetical protein [Sinorhizobium meliloti]